MHAYRNRNPNSFLLPFPSNSVMRINPSITCADGMASEEEKEDFSRDMLPAPDQIEEPAAAGNGNDKVRLILDKGWRIGKRIAITGVAISTAPILLPPLFIFSAFGLAFSVPFGLVFAGYACTDKIMRSLLLVATAPPHEEELYMKAQLSEQEDDVPPAPEYYYELEEPAEKVDNVHVTEIDGTEMEEDGEVEGKEGVPGVDKEEDVREITEDEESSRRLDLGEPPKDDREHGFKARVGEEKEEGEGKGEGEGEENVGVANREEKGQQGEEIVKEINKDDDDRSRLVGSETRKTDDYEIKQDVGDNIKKEDKEMQGRQESAKQVSEADDYGVPWAPIASTLNEGTPGTDSNDAGQLEKSSDHESRMTSEVAPLEEKPSVQDSSIPVPVEVTPPLDNKSLDQDILRP